MIQNHLRRFDPLIWSTARRSFRTIGVLLPALGLLGASLSVPRTARANSGNSFLETIGISIAVGTVLGASSLPFYDQPENHLINVAYGASAGAAVGIGILVYGLLAGPAQDGYENASLWRRSLNLDTGPGSLRSEVKLASVATPVPPATQFWMPVVSLNW